MGACGAFICLSGKSYHICKAVARGDTFQKFFKNQIISHLSAIGGPEGGEVMDPDEMNGLEAVTEFLEILDRLPHEDRECLRWLVRGMAMKAEQQAG